MADHLRIHPVHNNIEAPAAPATSSDEHCLKPPLLRRTCPGGSHRSRYYKCIIWTVSFLVLISIIISAKLSESSLPEFYQGYRNKTVFHMTMRGRSRNAAALLTSLWQELETTGTVPLDLRVDQQVRVNIGALKLPEVKVLLRCELEIDDDDLSEIIRLRNSRCTFRFRF